MLYISVLSILTGRLLSIVKDIGGSEIISMCLDTGNHGRTYYLGETAGTLMSVNFRAKTPICRAQLTNAEISCIGMLPGEDNNLVVGCSDGSIIVVHDTVENLVTTIWRLTEVFGHGIGVHKLAMDSSFKLVVAISSKMKWCVWNPSQGAPMAIGEELHNLTAVEIIGASVTYHSETVVERLLTFAIGSSYAIYIYTMELLAAQCFCNISLIPELPLFLNHFTVIRKGPSEINYAYSYPAKIVILAFSDDGQIASWDYNSILAEAEQKYRSRRLDAPTRLKKGRNFSVLKVTAEPEDIHYSYVEELLSSKVWQGHLDSKSAIYRDWNDHCLQVSAQQQLWSTMGL